MTHDMNMTPLNLRLAFADEAALDIDHVVRKRVAHTDHTPLALGRRANVQGRGEPADPEPVLQLDKAGGLARLPAALVRAHSNFGHRRVGRQGLGCSCA